MKYSKAADTAAASVGVSSMASLSHVGVSSPSAAGTGSGLSSPSTSGGAVTSGPSSLSSAPLLAVK